MPNNDYANEPNQSRSEEIIQSILDNTEYDEAARSRIEYLLIELKNAIEGGGGGGGVTSYSPLTEKPKIDNHTLQAGNNTSSDLGLQTKIDSEHKLSADNVDDTNSTNKFNVKSDWNAASGATAEILNKPTLGTASAKNVPAYGDAATGEVVLGSDTRLTDARNAKDVYNWAKQENKPSYNYSEIQNPPTIPDELADLADDSTHRTVTDTEKDAWNGKQNALTFDDAPTSNSNNPVKSGGVYTALSGKQNNLSEAQMAAANSGATVDKINKIAVNENNISLLETMNGAKNALNISTIEKSSNITTTLNSDKTITLSVTSANARSYVHINGASYIQNVYSNYILVWDNGGNQAINFGVTYSNNGTSWANESFNNTGSSIEINSNYQYLRFSMYFEANTAITNATVKIMLITKSAYNAGFTDYQPYALSNTTITPALKECVDNGAKNKVYTDNSGTFTASGSARSYDIPVTVTGNIAISFGSLTSTDTDSDSCAIVFLNSSNVGFLTISMNRGSNVSQTVTLTDTAVKVRIYPANSYNESAGDTVTWNNLMICDESLWKVSRNYQLPALSNAELTAKEQTNENNISLLTPNTVNTVKNNFTATDWTKIDELAFTIPAGKVAMFSASATHDANNKIIGLAFVRSTTYSVDNVLAIVENPNTIDYFSISCSGIRSRIGFEAENVNVFVKFSGAPTATSITRTYQLV